MSVFKKLILIALVPLFPMLSSCGMAKRMALREITVKKHAIPPEFGKDKSTLLLIGGQRAFDNSYKKSFGAEYHGKFEIITEDDLKSDDYADLDKYRYALNSDLVRNDDTSTYQFYIIDRSNNKKYKCPITSSFFKALIKAYAVNLEKERKA